MFWQTSELFSYGAPPLIGAFIGYLTNEVAIRMLFRPLKPWRIFGWRVPLTPGVIPSKRHLLAENIGEMVGGQLLTAADIGAAMSLEDFQDQLRRIVDERLNDVLSSSPAPLLDIVPQQFRIHVKIGLRMLKRRLKKAILVHMGSPSFVKAVGDMLTEQMNLAGSCRLDELLGAEERKGLHAVVDHMLAELLGQPGVAEQLGRWLEKQLASQAAEGRSLADLLPAELRELICSTVAGQTPQLLDQVAVVLSEPPVRDSIVLAVKGGLERIIDSLGPMAAIARGFVAMDGLDGIVRHWLEEREDSLAAWLRKPDMQKRAAQALTERAEAFLETPLEKLLEKIEPEQLQRICGRTASQIMAALSGEQAQRAASAVIRQHVDAMLEHGQISLAALAEKFLTKAGREKMQERLLGQLHAMRNSTQLQRLAGRMASSMLDQLAARPIGLLGVALPAEARNGMADYLVLTANQLLIKEAPGLTESLRIREMVTSKVNSLDLLRLERLLLSIMEEQFKYINLFGALLGFLIGLLNLAVMELF